MLKRLVVHSNWTFAQSTSTKLCSIVDTTLRSLKIKNHMCSQHTLKTPYIQLYAFVLLRKETHV